MSWLRKASLLCLTCYWSLLFLGTHIPGSAMPDIKASDKLQHWIAFVGLTFLISASLAGRRPSGARLLLAIAIATAYAALDELTQTLVPLRSADVRDWAADVLGSIVGAAVYLGAYLLVRRLGWIRNPEPTDRGGAEPAVWSVDTANEPA